METPSSTRRVTRSQALADLNNTTTNIPILRRIEDSEKGVSKSRQRATKQQQDRSALIDITNDSPIVGLATGGLETPSSVVSKQRTIRAKNNTPGSGETLLRCQVKTLLQKVEEEAELSKISLETRPFHHLQGIVDSPMLRFLAPTPANTPQVLNLSEDDANNGLASITGSPVIQEQMISVSQVVSDIFDGMIQESTESDINLISRSLLLDFSEKTESTECSSVVTEDDDSSVWSIQVNASIHDEEQEVVEEEVDDESYNDNNEENEAEAGLIDELCEEMSKINVNNNEVGVAAKFTGRHTRFLYNSDDEMVEEPANGVSPNVLCFKFKGLPTPKGKHIRFATKEEEIDDDCD